jgi:hypothetical protein
MSPENFCYWLQGYFEINNQNNIINKQQIEIIKDHFRFSI